ncbi:MAG: T9SS type A sorting domain-containing protein [Flavobacteriia bacterium]|nr:T9SS type A sorting domain-containing protein [Flavobacteriia bacterium]
MKKLLLSFFVIACTFIATSQVIFKVQSPANIGGLYTFTNNGDATGWGLANLNNPADAVEDTLVLVNDGTPGNNTTYGNLLSEEGCAASPANAYAGKIAVIRRNDCEFGLKALNAQNAGAIAVIIINRDPSAIIMGAGADGASVTIPVAMISSTDGDILLNEMLNGPVVVFLGSKQNVFNDDLGSLKKDLLIGKQFSSLTLLSQNATEFNDSIGIQVRNFGQNDQSNFTVTANINFNGASVYNEVSTPQNVVSGDSITVNFPGFSLPSYTPGKFTLTYTINTAVTDEDLSDNVQVVEFIINDSIYSLVPLDTITNLPINTGGAMINPFNTTYEFCIHFQDAHASRVKADGIYFNARTNSTDSLSGQTIGLNLYEITEQFADLNSAPSSFTLNPIAQTYYDYPTGNQANLQGANVYKAFDAAIALEDDKRYLFCMQTSVNFIFLGSHDDIKYDMNSNMYAQPLSPVIDNGTLGINGFSSGTVASIAVKMSLNDASLTEVNSIDIQAFPNPTKNNVTLTLPENGDVQITLTDLSGKVISNNTVNVTNGKTVVNMDNLDAGMYIINVIVNSKVAKVTVVKQ